MKVHAVRHASILFVHSLQPFKYPMLGINELPPSEMLLYAHLCLNAITYLPSFHCLQHLRTTVCGLVRLGCLGVLGSFHLCEERLWLRSVTIAS